MVVMRSLLSAFLVFVLVLSHGTMSAATLHSQGQAHHHGEVSHDNHDEGVSGEVAESPSDKDTERSDTSGQANVGHVHVVGDMVSALAVGAPVFAVREQKHFPRRDADLASSNVAPLLEPPSA